MTKLSVSTLVSLSLVVGCSLAVGCAAPTESDGAKEEASAAAPASPASSEEENLGTSSEELKLKPLDVAFANCSEVASITPIPVANARQVVPANLPLAGDGTVAPFVVRVANCASVRVDGGPVESGTVAQLGVGIVSPDGTGDINNYTAWYYTTSLRLALRLALLGVNAQWAPRLDYDLANGTLDIDAKFPNVPRFHVTASVVEPAFTIPFTANWWRQNGGKLTKMSTPIPVIHFGTATTTLTTPSNSALASLLGASTVSSFPFLDSFNRFPAATMTVTKN